MRNGSFRTDLIWMMALCILFAMGLCWNLLGSAEGSLIGSDHIDARGSYWFQWFVAGRLEHGGSLGQTDLWFHPWGIDILRTYGGNIVDPLLALPLRWLGGATLGWNGLLFGIIVTNGLAGGFWIRHRSGSLAAAAAASMLIMLHPVGLYDLAQGRPAQAILAPLIGALALFEASNRTEDPRQARWLAIGSGICIALASYCYWFGGLFAAMACGLLALGTGWKSRLLHLGVAALVTLVGVSPLLFTLLGTLDGGASGALLPVDQWWKGELDLITEAGDNITLCTLDVEGNALKLRLKKGLIASQVDAPLLGISSLLCVLFTARKAWRWTLVAALGVAIAIGPMPGGFRNPIYLAIALLPGMDRLYWPCRAIILSVPVAAVGASLLVEHFKAKGPIIAAGLGLIGLGESHSRGLIPLELWQAEPPPAVACLESAEGAVIALPYGQDHAKLIDQTVHEKALLGGARETSRSLVPEEQQEWVQTNPWIGALMKSIENPRAAHEWTEADREEVREKGYRWVLIRWDQIRRPNLREGAVRRERLMDRAVEAVAGPLRVDDGEVRIYAPFDDALDCELSPQSDG